MFVDYYALLEIEPLATKDEIKKAFRRLAVKYHPDKNTGFDTTKQMQLINEAYLFLKDTEGRIKYDREYQFYKQYEQKKKQEHEAKVRQEEERQRQPKQKEYQQRESVKPEPEEEFSKEEYTFHDETLKNWMKNAREQSVDLSKETIEDLRGMFKAGTNAAIDKVGNMLPGYLIGAVFMLIVVLLMKTCKQ